MHLSVLPNPSLSRDPTRQAAWASWLLGLCCATPPKRLAARVAVSSNVRPHTAGMNCRTASAFLDARRVQIQAPASARSGQRLAHKAYAGQRCQALRGERPRSPPFISALRGIRHLLASFSRQPVRRLAAGNRTVPPTNSVSGGEEALRLRSFAPLRVQQWSRAATFAVSGVRPNPSLSRDPTRQAAWAARRLGLCCTAPPKRLAARVAVSSNVRRHTKCVSASLRTATVDFYLRS
jgi:hypothetical protein